MREEISFGVWLRKQRRALDLSRKAFANQVGCAEITLRRIEAETLKPSKELASVLLQKLGIPEAERLQWISFARGLSGFPSQSIPSSNKPTSNLPALLTTFIGREKEQADVMRFIAEHRLVTLTGSGGIGKTRLAVRVGEQILKNYVDGVWFVELASLSDPALLPQTAATFLGASTQSDIPYVKLLINFLRPKSLLIILDNCEQIIDGCAHFTDALLKSCPQLKILATSRETMGVTGEVVYRVPSLLLPELLPQPDTFRDSEAITLFEERAQLVQFDFFLTAENAPSVAKICQRLDGIPLAIELAAAKVGILSIGQIAKQLEESFNILTGGSRTALPRHQTLRASINWSWNLLTESEQRLMQQLSVFVGGWTLEAAQSICDGDVMYLLNSLVTKSLIVVNRRTETNARYSFHQTIRQYAHEKLLEAGGVGVIRDKHLAYFVNLVEDAEPELYRSNQVFWFRKLDDELDNLRMALEWALATDIASGLRITSSPWRFWQRRNYRESRDWISQLLERYPQSDSLRAQALAVYSLYVFMSGNEAEARRIAEQGLQLARDLSDQQNEALNLLFLGRIITFPGHYHEGTPFLEHSLGLYRTLGDKIGQATATSWLSKNHNDLEHSKSLVLESLKLQRDLGNLSGIAWCLTFLAYYTIIGEDFSSPTHWLEEAITIYRELGDQLNEADVLGIFGILAYWQGDYQQACAYYEEAIRLYDKVGGSWSSLTRLRMAYVFMRQSDFVQAKETFEVSLQHFQNDGPLIGLIYSIEGLASLYLTEGQTERAVRLFAWADVMREKIGDHRPPVEQNSVEGDLAVIRSDMDDAEFTKFSEEGRSMTVEQAVALASDTV